MTEGGGLTVEQLQQLQAWLTNKTRGKSVACSVCAQSQWTVLNNFVVLRSVDLGGSEAGSGYPHVALSCANCGQTLLMNAIKTGIFA